MRRYATVARAENGMDAIDPADRPTAAAGLTFVAGRRHVVEVVTARALHDVAANGRRIPQLRAGSGEQRARQQWVPICDPLVVSCIRVADESPKPQAAVRRLLDPIKGSWLMSTSRIGRSTSSFIKSMRFVPPAMNFTPLTEASRMASEMSAARE